MGVSGRFGSNATGPGDLACRLMSALLRKRSDCCAATNCRDGPQADSRRVVSVGHSGYPL
jgi:hypothetical protein